MIKSISKNTKGAYSPIRTAIPGSIDLAENFLNFIQTGAIEEVHYQGLVPDVPSAMPVELSVSLSGSIHGTLVIRCRPEFQKWFIENRENNSSSSLTGKLTFNEMVTLYSIFLIQKFWLSKNFEMGPIDPKFSTPNDWPVREPNVTCGLLAGENPLEIRLWLD